MTRDRAQLVGWLRQAAELADAAPHGVCIGLEGKTFTITGTWLPNGAETKLGDAVTVEHFISLDELEHLDVSPFPFAIRQVCLMLDNAISRITA